jgi:hypothetical protein
MLQSIGLLQMATIPPSKLNNRLVKSFNRHAILDYLDFGRKLAIILAS